MAPLTSFQTRIATAFAVAAAVVVLLLAATWVLSEDATRALKLTAQDQEVLDALALTRADTIEIELLTQNFRLTGDVKHLAERNKVVAVREVRLTRIHQLIAGHPGQEARFTDLRSVIAQRLAISVEVERLRNTEGPAAANAYVAAAPLQQTRAKVFAVLTALSNEERRQLDAHNADQLRTRRSVVTTGTMGALLLGVVLVGTFLLILRQSRTTEASQRALATSEESLSATLRSIGDGVIACDVQGQVTRMNPAAEALTGWTFDEAKGKRIGDVLLLRDSRNGESIAVDTLEAIPACHTLSQAGHIRLLSRIGNERPASDNVTPIYGSIGQLTGIVHVLRDQTAEHLARRNIEEQNELLEWRVQERTAQLRASEDHLRQVINHIPVLVAYVDADERYSYVNEQYKARFAPHLPDITGLTVREVLGEERYAVAAPRIKQALAGHALNYDWQPFPGVWQAINYVPRWDDPGDVAGYYVLGSDITGRKASEDEMLTLNRSLERSMRGLERSNRALRTLSAGNRVMTRAVTEKELLDEMCATVVREGGYALAAVWFRSLDESKTLTAAAGVGSDIQLSALFRLKTTWADTEEGAGVVATAIRSHRICVANDIRNHPAYGKWRTTLPSIGSGIACPLRVGQDVVGALGVYSEEPFAIDSEEEKMLGELADDLAFGITSLRAQAEKQRISGEMQHLVLHDALTGLPNETQFVERLSESVGSTENPGGPFALLQVNIERLNEINDALGFSRGDQLLRLFGARFAATAPPMALTARLRGDEFAMLLPGPGLAVAMQHLQTLEDNLKQPFVVADLPLTVTLKAGVALFPQHGSTAHELLRHADIALNFAKTKGLAHAVFQSDQDGGQSGRLAVAADLRKAIEQEDLLLYLQPKVDMRTGRVCGAEGLVRWRHAQRGLVPPSEFIGLAEHTGLIGPITDWVVKAGLKTGHEWATAGHPLPVALNLSPRNLRDRQLVDKILASKAVFPVPPGMLELEVTESTVMDDPEYALDVLHALRDQDIPLCIDDFGTGYSSLSYLQKLPIDYIKIDQSFVRDMMFNPDSAAIVRSTISLIHDLGRNAIAEGIETLDQWKLLMEFGCDVGQGYLIAKPMPAENFSAWAAAFKAPVVDF